MRLTASDDVREIARSPAASPLAGGRGREAAGRQLDDARHDEPKHTTPMAGKGNPLAYSVSKLKSQMSASVTRRLKTT